MIEIKKMILIQSILALNDEEIFRQVFCAHTEEFLNNTVRAEDSVCGRGIPSLRVTGNGGSGRGLGS